MDFQGPGQSAEVGLPREVQVAAHSYWEQRARRFAADGRGLRAVCSFGMPAFYNLYIDWTQRLALAPWLRSPANMRILEVGCGVGRWSLFLARSGARVTGIDLASTMVEEARRRAERCGLAARCRFLVADVAELALAESFERILGVTVLQHILDPARFQAAVDRLAAHLAARGRLILLEASPARRVTRCDTANFCAREAAIYHAAFARAGLRCLAVRGVDPAPFKTHFLPWYARLPRPLALAGLAAVTGLSLPLDIFAGRSLVRSSWHKVFVLAHAGS